MKNNSIGADVLGTITSALYEDTIVIFREYVQNSLDAYNEIIDKNIVENIEQGDLNISIDINKNTITILDDGYGIESKYFESKMLTLGNSNKDRHKKEYIGFRGIGRLSALLFCDKLTFYSKYINEEHINVCEFNGKKYIELVDSSNDKNLNLEEIIGQIKEITKEDNVEKDKHFFKVVIEDYHEIIKEVIDNKDFKEKLSKLLPLKYLPDFADATHIIDEYKKITGEDLTRFMCNVKLDGDNLYKPYTPGHILASGIKFWTIRDIDVDTKKGEVIGMLWFTFNQKIKQIKANDTDFGILVRSKNILMGNNETFAIQTSKYSYYVSTYSELVASLRGVYGELLVNSKNLEDNASRDWFRTDRHSIYFRSIICNFMESLHDYRYKASKYFNAEDKESDTGKSKIKITKAKDDLKNALKNAYEKLTLDNIDFFLTSYQKAKMKERYDENEDDVMTDDFSDIDIPLLSLSKRKFYDELLKIIYDFFVKEKKRLMFSKMRAYIKSKLEKSELDEQ